MKPHALWGGAFALVAAAIAVVMVVVVSQSAAVLPTQAPQTTLDYQAAYLPALQPVAAVTAWDQMFTVAYAAAFIGAALSWRRPAALSLVTIVAGLATAGIDVTENVRTALVMAGLPAGPPRHEDLELLDLLGALKWVGGGATSLAIAGIIPKRGIYFVLVALFLGLGGAAELLLGAVRLDLLPMLAAIEPALANGVILAMPVGLLLTGIALLSEARTAP